MAKLIGYMVTWTTYGSWLQGDKRGYIKDSAVLPGNPNLQMANRYQKSGDSVILTPAQKQIVERAIIDEARRIKQKVYALAVCSNHIHLVLENNDETIGNAVRRYKYSATKLLRENGLMGKIWTKGFDKGYCYNYEQLQKRIQYVKKHNI